MRLRKPNVLQPASDADSGEPPMTVSRECASQFSTEAEIWKEFPKIVHDVFADNVVAVVFVVAMILSYVLPKDMEVIHKKSRTE